MNTDHDACALDHSPKAYHELEEEAERLREEWSQVYAANEQLIRDVERAEWQNAKLLVSEACLRRIEERVRNHILNHDEWHNDLRAVLDAQS